MTSLKHWVAFGAVLFLAPSLAAAKVRFSEIMYDVEGSDEGREWVEVLNGGTESADLSTYKFRENNSNHSLTVFQGSASLASNSYAVIADDPTKFLNDHAGFSGIIFDSSFSLSNAGELLVLRNPGGEDEDSYTYSSDTGAAGDGKSLQFSGSSWVSATPTPGFGAETASSETETTNTSSSSASAAGSATYSGPSPVERLYAFAGGSRGAVAGADIIFEGASLGTKQEPLNNPRYVWVFGDGSALEGQKVTHAYRYPGEYVLSLSVSSGILTGADYATIKVRDPEIRLLAFYPGSEGYAEVENASSYELDLSRWHLDGGAIAFYFPDGTKLLPGRSVKFPNGVTNLYQSPTLKYPNGRVVPLLPAKKEVLSPNPPAKPTASPKKTTSAEVVSETPNKLDRSVAASAVSKSSDVDLFGFSSSWAWYVGITALGLVGALGVIILLRYKETSSPEDEFEIVE